MRDEFVLDLLGGCIVIHINTTDGKPLKFIPYFHGRIVASPK